MMESTQSIPRIGTYRDSSLSVAERVRDLMGRMTVREKVCQLGSAYAYGGSIANMEQALASGIGQVGMSSGTTSLEGNAQLVNTVQDHLLHKTRLGIPALFHVETLNGGSLFKATTYPIPLGLASTWNPDNVRKMGDEIRQEMSAAGMKFALAPVVDVARDPRWGRMGETYGESPALISAMGTAYVQGIQGSSGQSESEDKLAACAKHFLGYSASEGGLNMAGAHIGPRELREVYARPFQALIRDADLKGVMNCYLAIDGEPVTGSKKYLTDLLRGELGFTGLTLSDYGSIEKLADVFHLTQTHTEAGILALRSGLDTEAPGRTCLNDELIQKIETGELPEEILDAPLRRLLTLKFELGLFEHPYADLEKMRQLFSSPAHLDTSLELAQESIVLLKNENALLPLRGNYRKIALIGPGGASSRTLFGGYTYIAFYEGMLAMLKGIAASMGLEGVGAMEAQKKQLESMLAQMPDVEQMLARSYGAQPGLVETLRTMAAQYLPGASVQYEPGCDFLREDRSGFPAAVALAEQSDFVILLLGGKNGSGTGCTMGENVDSSSIGLPGVQEELARAVKATGKPVVLIHMDGRPLSSCWASENLDAILEAWHPGQCGAKAIGNVLFGLYNPGGKMPATALRSVGQIPMYAEQPNGSGTLGRGRGNNDLTQGYVNEPGFPLYPFGYGLSYTTFSISGITLLEHACAADGCVHVTCQVQNTGSCAGDEVVQLYFRDPVATAVRPQKELAGFQRVHLLPGEQVEVRFTFAARQTAFIGLDHAWRVEAGDIELFVGNRSDALDSAGCFQIQNTILI